MFYSFWVIFFSWIFSLNTRRQKWNSSKNLYDAFKCIIQIFVELIFRDKNDIILTLLNLIIFFKLPYLFLKFLFFVKLIEILFLELFYHREKHIFQDTSFSLSLTSCGESFQRVTQSFCSSFGTLTSNRW